MQRRRALAATAITAGAVLCVAGVSLSERTVGAVRPAPRRVAPVILPSRRTPTPPAPRLHRPNVLLITTDDMDVMDLKYMPHVRRLIEHQGVNFTNGLAPTPICVPARASLLTGQYATTDGARTISGPYGGFRSFHDGRTLPVDLRKAGYDTLFAGKYLNGYGETRPRYVPPGWTDWRATGRGTYNFFDQTLNINGRLRHVHRYTTYTMRDQANAMMSAPRRRHRPWFLWLNYVAPHVGAPVDPSDPSSRETVPAPADRHRYTHIKLPDRPDMFEKDVADKPKVSPAHRHVRPRVVRVMNIRRIQALQAVDRAVASHLRVLRRTHQLAHTLVIFTSDNGYSLGEHNIVGKLYFYNEILRIPILMRGPGIPHHRTIRTPITNPDVEATILAATGARSQRPLDGVSLLPWLEAPPQQRVIPIGAWEVGNGSIQRYRGVVVGHWVYARYHDGAEEAYNLRPDPYELRSIVKRRADPAQLRQLRALANAYDDCRGRTCPKAFYPLH